MDPHTVIEGQKRDRSLLAIAAMQSLWPAFIGAGLCAGVVFSLFDPHQADTLPEYFPQSAEGVYTVTFLLMWLANTAGCLTSWYLASDKVRKGS